MQLSVIEKKVSKFTLNTNIFEQFIHIIWNSLKIRIKDIVNIEVSSQIQEGGQDERNFVLTAKGQQLVEDAINYREINSELRELANYSEHAGLDITQPFTDTYLEDNDLQFDLDAMMKLGVVENYKKAINESATHDCHCGGSCCDDKH